MLRKISLIVMCLLPAAVANADERGAGILARVASELRSYDGYEVCFTASASGMDDVSGKYIVSGDRYSITVGDQTHFSDGENRFEVNPTMKEIVIDRVDLSSRNIFSNPARAFEFAGEEFDGTWISREQLSGHECDIVRLVPLSRAYGAGMIITMYVSAESGLPVALSYDYEGEQIDVSINKITRLRDIDSSMFTFEKEDFEGYDVVDFR